MKTSVVAVCLTLMAFASCQKSTEGLAPAPPAVTPKEVINGGFENTLEGWVTDSKSSFSASLQAAKSGQTGLHFTSLNTPVSAKIYQAVTGLADGQYTYSVYAEGVGTGMYIWADGGAGEVKVPIPVAVDSAHTMPVSSIDFTVKGGVANIGFITENTDKDNSGVGAFTSEGEMGKLEGAVVSSAHTGFTGTGFVDFINNSNDFVEWTVNKATTSAAELTFRYAHGGGTNRSLTLLVNDLIVKSGLNFLPTGAWNTWGNVTETVSLVAGVNKIKLMARGFNGPNVDNVKVKSLQVNPYFYADDATLSKK